MTWLDTAVPFLPWTIPVYVSYLVYTFIVVARSRNDHELREIFLLTHLQLFLAVGFFILYPVTFPRQDYYFSDPVSAAFNRFWVWFDAPSNCLPSLHTILCLTAIRHSLDKPNAPAYTAWGVAIIATTLTCKQHYAVDIAAGFAVFCLSLWIYRWSGIEKMARIPHRNENQPSKP